MSGGTVRVDWAERVAIGASLACMVHCLALPLLIALLPALAAVLAVPESFHLWVLALAVPMALLALVQGRARHGRTGPLAAGAAGLACLVLGALAFAEGPAETAFTVVGSVLLVGAHVTNWRLRHRCC